MEPIRYTLYIHIKKGPHIYTYISMYASIYLPMYICVYVFNTYRGLALLGCEDPEEVIEEARDEALRLERGRRRIKMARLAAHGVRLTAPWTKYQEEKWTSRLWGRDRGFMGGERGRRIWQHRSPLSPSDGR